MAKKSSSSAKQPKGKYRTFADIDRDLESLAGVLVAIQQTIERLEEHVQELDLKTVFTMNAISITRVKHGGIIGVSGEPDKVTKKLMQWYRDGGREQLIMKLQEAENAITKARAEAAAEGNVAEDAQAIEEAPDDTDPGTTKH